MTTAYAAYGSLWDGYKRGWETAEAEVVARYAGVSIEAVRSGRLAVTLAEVEQHLTVNGIAHPANIPDKLPAPSPAEAAWCVEAMLHAGLALVPARPGEKPPVSGWWDTRTPIGRDAAITHLVAGGNLDYDAGQSGVVVIDSENAAATAALVALGLVPDALTAKAQDPTSSKFGGAHFIIPIPAGVDRSTLETRTAITLPGGGVVDILAGPADPTIHGTRVVVGLGSRLDVAPGYRYGHTEGGVFATGEFANRGTAAWLFTGDAECPDAVTPLHGILLPRRRREYTPNPNTDRVTQLVDGMDVDEILARQTRAWITGYDSDGCYVLGWDQGSDPRSLIIHDGCARVGYGVHGFSGHMQAEWGRSHGSRLQFAALIHGEPEAAIAERFGIELGTKLRGISLEDLGVQEVPQPDLHLIQGSGEGGVSVAPPLGVAPPIGTVWGRPDSVATADEAALKLGPPPALGVAEHVPDEVAVPADEDTGVVLLRRIDAIDASGFWESLPTLKVVARAADSNGVGRWGLLGAMLPRIACTIPPHVRLVNSAGHEGGPNSGASLNLFSILTGPPEEGKSETIKLAADLVPLPDHAVKATTGTGEGIIKSFGFMRKTRGRQRARGGSRGTDQWLGPTDQHSRGTG